MVLLKWKSSASETVALPGTPTLVTAAAYPTCVAPCMTEVFLHDGFSNPLDDTTSSAFYDYTNDVAWVGGTLGWLHKITPVFNGVPAEVSTGGFPVQVAKLRFFPVRFTTAYPRMFLSVARAVTFTALTPLQRR